VTGLADELPTLRIVSQTAMPMSDLVAKIEGIADSRRCIVAIDGLPGSGKSTFGKILAKALPAASLIAVDDISWYLHMTNWVPELLDGVLRPWLAGESVDYRPPGWEKMNRPGSIIADSRKFLVLEGCGATRHALASVVDYAIWVNTDPALAWQRMIDRDVALDTKGRTRAEIEQFVLELDAPVIELFQAERPWRQADLIIDGRQLRDQNLAALHVAEEH